MVCYFQKNKGNLFRDLEELTCDMWEGYVNATDEVFEGKVRVTIDLFHVIKKLQEELTQARRAIQRQLGSKAAKQLKGSRWLWQTCPENLTDEQRQKLEKLKEDFPRLKELLDQRDSLRDIFQDTTIRDAQTGQKRLQEWMKKALAFGSEALTNFCKTLNNWMSRIANYFVWRSSNGRTEGYNHGLRNILWRAFGMLNFQNFRARVLDRFGKRSDA